MGNAPPCSGPGTPTFPDGVGPKGLFTQGVTWQQPRRGTSRRACASSAQYRSWPRWQDASTTLHLLAARGWAGRQARAEEDQMLDQETIATGGLPLEEASVQDLQARLRLELV